MEKYHKQDVAPIEKENERDENYEASNPQIDSERKKNNYRFTPYFGKTYTEFINGRIKELGLSPRKDAVVMNSFVLGSDKAFFDGLAKVEQYNFFSDCYKFFAERYGEENIIAAVVHNDETTPHMHLNLMPITQDGRLCSKQLFDKPQLQQLQTDKYCPEAGNAVLIMSKSEDGDAETIKNMIVNAEIGIKNITLKTTVDLTEPKLYLGYDDLNAYGKKMQAVNSVMKLGNNETTVFTFRAGEELAAGEINLVNSNFYAADGKQVVFNAKTDKSYVVVGSDKKNEDVSGLIVEMNAEDYAAMFAGEETSVQSALYYASDGDAKAAVKNLPGGYMGMLSDSDVYVQNAGDVFTNNILWYLALIAASLLFAMLISVIFMRSVKIFQADFAVYRTLGISRKISSRSLYVQMALIFLPTLVLLPAVSLIATLMPFSSLPFISAGNYFFVEFMLLLIVECVAFGFNRNINGQSIRKSLRRGSK